MKTFEDAFKSVTSDKEMLLNNLTALGIKPSTHEQWAKFIKANALDLVLTIIKKEHSTSNIICSELQFMFEMGLLVGMEMEKPDANSF